MERKSKEKVEFVVSETIARFAKLAGFPDRYHYWGEGFSGRIPPKKSCGIYEMTIPEHINLTKAGDFTESTRH